MNVASAMETPLFLQNVSTNIKEANSDNGTNGKGSLFQTLLLKNTSAEETGSDQEIAGKADETDEALVLNNLTELMHSLFHLIDDDESDSLESLLPDKSLIEELDWDADEIQAIVAHLLEDPSRMDASVEEDLQAYLRGEKEFDASILQDISVAFSQSDEGKVMKSSEQFMQKAEDVLQTIKTSDDDEGDHTKQLAKLMNAWHSLAKKSETSAPSILKAVLASNEGSDEQVLWEELLDKSQKQSLFGQKRSISSDTKITTNDVSRWLQELIPNQEKATGDNVSAHLSNNFRPSSMTQIEQFVIHMGQGQQSDSGSKQLLNQFQQIIHSSKFLTTSNGTNQLSIALKPENLGHMTVKLTEMDGEMTAKILVSSHAAKDMLESNIHQLKNMFSPHQIVIERMGENGSQVPTPSHEEGENSFADQEEQHQQSGDESSSNDPYETSDENKDFRSQMDELMLNEIERAGEMDGWY